MTAHKTGISISKYLTTKTRHEFEEDSRSVLSGVMLPLQVVADSLVGDGGGEQAIPTPKDKDKDDSILAPNASAEKRAIKSRTVYSWYRRASGRNYRVHNLDTRSPSEFKQATRMLGRSLAVKQ